MSLSGSRRKDKLKGGSGTLIGFTPDVAPQLFYNQANQIESQSGAFSFDGKRIPRAVKFFEKLSHSGLGNADPAIPDCPMQIFRLIRQLNFDLGADRSVFYGIGKKVDYDLPEKLHIRI